MNDGTKITEGSVKDLTVSDRMLSVRVEEDPIGAWAASLEGRAIARRRSRKRTHSSRRQCFFRLSFGRSATGGHRDAFQLRAPPLVRSLSRSGLKIMRYNLVGIIIAREVKERTRSKFFRIGLTLTVILVVMGVVIPSLASRNTGTPTYSIGVIAPATAGLVETLEAQGPA